MNKVTNILVFGFGALKKLITLKQT